MTQWKDSIALSASAPIRYEDKVVGVVLTGLLIDRGFVESLSRPGAEVAIFYGNRLVVKSFRACPRAPWNSFGATGIWRSAGRGRLERVQQLQLGHEDYTVTYLPLEEGEKPWESLIVVQTGSLKHPEQQYKNRLQNVREGCHKRRLYTLLQRGESPCSKAESRL